MDVELAAAHSRPIFYAAPDALVIEVILRAAPTRSGGDTGAALTLALPVSDFVVASSLAVGARDAEDGKETEDADGGDDASDQVNAKIAAECGDFGNLGFGDISLVATDGVGLGRIAAEIVSIVVGRVAHHQVANGEPGAH